MIRDKRCPLLVKAETEKINYQHITSEDAGWNMLNFSARVMKKGETWNGNTGGYEYLFVLLGGNFSAETPVGSWQTVNGRNDVFGGLPHALYLPPETSFSITADSDILDLACGWCAATELHPAMFIAPEDVKQKGIEFRGGDNASRQINSILPPGSACHRLVCVEVYTPSGNWSSFPAHKHDTRKLDPVSGKVTEACLEEVYFYKME